MSIRSVLAFALLAAAAGPARAADPACNALPSPLPAPLYVSGSTALEPMLKTIGPKIAKQATNAYTIVYLRDGACSGVNRAFTDGLIKANMFYIPPDYDSSKAPPTCTVDTTVGIAGDLVLADTVGSLCPNVPAQPADVGDFTGPVNDMTFVVPATSTQTAISAEMGYLIFGMGNTGGVAPWTDPTFYFIRPPTSGTRAQISANLCGMGSGGSAVCLGKTNWIGQSTTAAGAAFGSGDVFNNVAMLQNTVPEKGIGILGEDYLDQGNNRTQVKALAFRAYQQERAYWPDSSQTSRDRKNVRDGHYKIWGYVHVLTKIASGAPTNAKAKFFIDLLQGKVAGDGFDTQDAITDSHLTPLCAMHVTHDIEGGDQKAYSSDAPCDCSFEARATGVATPPGCTACTGGTCASGVCRKGFCESK